MAQRSRKKSFFKTAWFYVPLLLLVIGVSAAAITYGVVSSKYSAIAEEFDLGVMTQMESASIIYDRNEKVFGHIYIQNRDTITLDEVAPEMIKAVIATEDARYYNHNGVDMVGIVRAAITNYRAGRIAQGASTITQQLARNTFELLERSYERKLIEIFLARRIEKAYSKQEILEMYLNRIYFGSGLYGVESAAKGYFGKPALELTLSEAATLSGLIKSPNRYSPWRNKEGAIEQRNYVLARMLEEGLADRATIEATLKEDIDVKPRTGFQSDNYAIDSIRQQVIEHVGWEQAFSDGFRVYTTFDVDLQTLAEKSMREQFLKIDAHPENEHETYAEYDAGYREFEKRERAGEVAENESYPLPKYIQGALVLVENQTGQVIAMVGGRSFNHSEYNRVLQGRVAMGTAFTPVVFAAAFDEGVFPGQLIDDGVIDNRQVMIGGETGILGEWGVESQENLYEGPIPARQVLVKSKNAATVRLGNEVGLPSVLEMAEKMGIASQLREYPSTFLGSSEVSLMDMALAYTNFPNGGWHPKEPLMIRRIESKDGRVIYESEQSKVQAMQASTAYQIHHMLRESLIRGTGSAAYSEHDLIDFEAGGKTGTSYDFTDNVFIGYSDKITCAVWAGMDRPQKMYHGAFSKDTVLPIWVEVMNAANKRFKPDEIEAPEGIQRYEVCFRSGQLATEDCMEKVPGEEGQIITKRTTYYEYATEEQAPEEECALHSKSLKSYVKSLPGQEEWPRAVAVANVSAIVPVTVQSATVVGEVDPYQAVRPSPGIAQLQKTDANKPVRKATLVADEEAVEVRRAEVARPFDLIGGDDVMLPLEAPPPIEF